MTDSCMELKNIQYNTMLKKGHNLTPTINSSVYTEINSFLNEEMKLNLNKSWIQLDNTNKLKKLYTFAEEYCKKHEINDVKILKLYLKNCLIKKRLQYDKEIIYDNLKQTISEIPNLQLKNKKFSMKRGEKKSSILKCLTPAKKTKKNNKIDTN